jgi:NADP-dependent 3-hydroxy acid dehydrogenase YdfG
LLEAAAESMKETAARVRWYQADLTQDQDIHELKARVLEDIGHIDILVGAHSLGRVEQASVEDFDWQYQANVRGAFALTQAVLPMLRARQGQIVFVNSQMGFLQARANMSQYAATKHALKAVADSLREEVNADGVRVLSLFVGSTATPLQEAIHAKAGKIYRPEQLLQPEVVASVVVHALSLPRCGEITDISLRPLIKPA